MCRSKSASWSASRDKLAASPRARSAGPDDKQQQERRASTASKDQAEADLLAQRIEELGALTPTVAKGWIMDKAGEDKEFAVKLDNGQVSLWSLTRYRDVDAGAIVSAVAALVEVQLCPEHKPNVLKVEPLASGTTSAAFRVWQNGAISRCLEDNVSLIRLTDDLAGGGDGSVYIFADPPAAAQTEVHGVPFPPPDKGAVRFQEARSAFRIIPSSSLGGNGFTMISLSVSRPSAKAYSFLSSMPTFAFRTFLRRTGRQILDNLKRFLDTSESLKQAIQNGPRRAWYQDLSAKIAARERTRAAAPPQVPQAGDDEEGLESPRRRCDRDWAPLGREAGVDRDLEEEFVNCFGLDFAAFVPTQEDADGVVDKVARFFEDLASLVGAGSRPECYVDYGGASQALDVLELRHQSVWTGPY